METSVGRPCPARRGSEEEATVKCRACEVEMTSLGQVPVRVGGTSGGWHLLFKELADANEQLWPLDVYRCGSCKRVEFFDLDLSLPER